MTFQESTIWRGPALRIRRPALGALAGVGRALAAGVRRMQYGQMLVVLTRLNDAQLAAISLRRCDIPARAHRLIYGPG
jgi:hypothetical protein